MKRCEDDDDDEISSKRCSFKFKLLLLCGLEYFLEDFHEMFARVLRTTCDPDSPQDDVLTKPCIAFSGLVVH